MDERQGQDQDSNSGDKAELDASAKTSSESSQEAAANGQESAAASDVPAEGSSQRDGQTHDGEAAVGGSEPEPIKFGGALPALISHSPDASPILPAAAAPASRPGSLRFLLLAATIACAAGIGALAGSLSASGIASRHVASAPIAKTADTREVTRALRTQLAELSALKANLDSTSRSTTAQFAKIAGRLDTLEHAQAEPAAKLAHIADAVDRLNKRGAAGPDITGSIATAPPPPPSPQVTPAGPAGPVLHDWIVQDVRNGRAMVESRHGNLYLVGSGSVMPGLGRVQDVRRQDGEWIVVTESGVITSRPLR